MTVPATDETSLRLQLISARPESLTLRTRLATLEHRNKQLRNQLRRYENSKTPTSKEGGAGVPPDDDDPTDEGEHPTGDDNRTDNDTPSDVTEQAQNDDASGDSDAANDSDDTSPVWDSGHEGTTRPPPDPDLTVWVDEAHWPDCGCLLTDPDRYPTQTVIDTPLPVPVTVTEYQT